MTIALRFYPDSLEKDATVEIQADCSTVSLVFQDFHWSRCIHYGVCNYGPSSNSGTWTMVHYHNNLYPIFYIGSINLPVNAAFYKTSADTTLLRAEIYDPSHRSTYGSQFKTISYPTKSLFQKHMQSKVKPVLEILNIEKLTLRSSVPDPTASNTKIPNLQPTAPYPTSKNVAPPIQIKPLWQYDRPKMSSNPIRKCTSNLCRRPR